MVQTYLLTRFLFYLFEDLWERDGHSYLIPSNYKTLPYLITMLSLYLSADDYIKEQINVQNLIID